MSASQLNRLEFIVRACVGRVLSREILVFFSSDAKRSGRRLRPPTGKRDVGWLVGWLTDSQREKQVGCLSLSFV